MILTLTSTLGLFSGLMNYLPFMSSLLCSLFFAVIAYKLLYKLLPLKRDLFTPLALTRELESLIYAVASRLQVGYSLELALHESFLNHKGSLKEVLRVAVRLIEEGCSADRVIDWLSSRPQLKNHRRFLMMISRLSAQSPLEAGKLLSKVAALLRKNRLLRESVERVFKYEEYKVKVLSTIYAASLASFAHLLLVITGLMSWQSLDVWVILLTFGSLVVTAPFFALLAIGSSRFFSQSLISISTFISVFLVLSSIL